MNLGVLGFVCLFVFVGEAINNNKLQGKKYFRMNLDHGFRNKFCSEIS